MKKALTITSISCIIVSALLGILFAFGVIEIEGFLGKLLLTLLIVGIGALLSLNGASLLERSFNILAIISLAFISLSCLLAVIQFWAGFKWGLFGQLTLIISIFSILFNFIVSYILKLGRQKLGYQIATYSFMAIFDIFITIQIINGDFLDGFITRIFIVDIILAFVGMAILAILSKKSLNNENPDFVKIPKAEYQALKERIAELEKELENYSKTN